MKKSTRSGLYHIFLSLIIVTLGILFLKYVFGIKGIYNKAGQYISLEGFQPVQTSPLFTDAYTITLDKYPERYTRIKANAEEAGIVLKRWKGVVITKDDVKSLPGKGVGTVLYTDRTGKYYNFGVIGCFLAHRGLLEHISQNPTGLGTLIFEDDVIIPADFYAKLAAVASEIPDDWDYIFMRKFVVKSKKITTRIQKLEKDVTSSTNMGLWGFIVKNSSIKTKILPVLEQMTDAVDFQLGRNADTINMYLIDPPIINFDISHDDSTIAKMDESSKKI